MLLQNRCPSEVCPRLNLLGAITRQLTNRLLIVGNRSGSNIGGCFERAAIELGIPVSVVEASLGTAAPRLVQFFAWRVLGKRPIFLNRFSRQLLEICERWRPECLAAIGTAPINAQTLSKLGALGILTVNYATDDPWNPAHRATWFLRALPQYNIVFSPRRANLRDLKNLGAPQVVYLPFGYDPDLHHPVVAFRRGWNIVASDVIFAGGADADRVPYIAALVQTGIKIALYGDYWERFAQTRAYTHGHVDPETLCQATGAAKISLCLVRRANRDGHVMRSFEAPAMGACMLVEDTLEHREFFGQEGQAVVYFKTIDQMLDQTRWLLDHPEERARLAATAHARIVNGHHTYRDRLETILASSSTHIQSKE